MCWILLLVFGQQVASDVFPEAIQHLALQSVVRISSTHENQTYVGTGTIVGQRGDRLLILTADHVLAGANFHVEFWPHNAASPVVETDNVLARNEQNDVALLSTPVPQGKWKQLTISAADECPDGEFLSLTIGCSSGESPSGEVCRTLRLGVVKHNHGESRFWITDREAQAGRSGGPMIDQRGRVLGVCSGRGNGRAFYGSLRAIHELCDSAGLASLYTPEQPRESAAPHVVIDTGSSMVDANRTVVLTASLAAAAPTQWSNPAHWRAEADLRLILDVRSDDSEAFPTPASLRLQIPPEVELVNGPQHLDISGPGRIEVPLTFGFHGDRTRDIEIQLEVVEAIGIEWEQAVTVVHCSLVPPPLITTTVRFITLQASSLSWTHLVEATAACQVEVRVEVTGPLGDRMPLALTAPVGVRELALSHQILRSGVQIIALRMTAVMRPGPAINKYVFSLQAPTMGAIRIHVVQPLSVSVSGPPPVQLVLSQDERFPQSFDLEWPKNDSVVLAATPRIAGTNLTLGVMARIATAPPWRLESMPEAAIGERCTVRLLAADSAPTASLFRDTTCRGWLTVSSVIDTPAIIGSRYQVVLRREAPFKRVICLLIAIAFLVLVIVLPCRILAAGKSLYAS